MRQRGRSRRKNRRGKNGLYLAVLAAGAVAVGAGGAVWADTAFQEPGDVIEASLAQESGGVQTGESLSGEESVSAAEESVSAAAEESTKAAEESTKAADEDTRKGIRHHVIPYLEQKVNRRAVEHMAKTSLDLMEAEEYFSAQAKRLFEQYAVPGAGEVELSVRDLEYTGDLGKKALRGVSGERLSGAGGGETKGSGAGASGKRTESAGKADRKVCLSSVRYESGSRISRHCNPENETGIFRRMEGRKIGGNNRRRHL